MSFFENLYQKLFSPKNRAANIHHEVIERNEKFRFLYAEWKDSQRAAEMVAAYKRSYFLKQAGINDPHVHLFDSPAAKGFAFTFNEDFSTDDFHYLFDWLADRVKLLGYRLVNSDVKMSEKNGAIETKEMHYLKPPIGSFDSATDQFYGNILIEHVLLNDEPSYIKLLANTYSDRLYLEPRPYSELIEHLFQ